MPEIELMTDGGLNVSRYNFSQSMQVIRPVARLESRYYYNQSARAQKGKRTGNNSANFWSLSVKYAFKSIKETDFTYGNNITIDGTTYFVEYPLDEYSLFTVASGWGFQRMLGRKFSFDLNLGVGLNYFSDNKEWMVGPDMGLRFGYVIR